MGSSRPFLLFGRCTRMALALSLLLAFGIGEAFAEPNAAQREASLAIVFAVDVSASVGADAYVLERDGIARAFLDPGVVREIAASPGGIEALVLEWSDPESVVTTVPWTQVTSAKSARAFAATVRATRRSSRGVTAIGPAILAGSRAFVQLPRPAARRVIDICGEGMANFGLPPALARDRAAALGITVNALAILDEEPWLADYFRRQVIAGASAFVLSAKNFESFARAMRRKLEVEIAGRPLGAPADPGRREAQMQ
jgi:Ca-activated chloride channel family protein